MADLNAIVVSGATEGIVDESVVRRLIRELGAEPGPVHGKNGKQHLRERITGFNNAARYSPWIVLLDLDHDAECAPPLRSHWLPEPAPFMCLRIAVRQVEAWLLADRKNIAKFLAVAASRVPRHVETLDQRKGGDGGSGETLAASRHPRRHGAPPRQWTTRRPSLRLAFDRVRTGNVEPTRSRATKRQSASLDESSRSIDCGL